MNPHIILMLLLVTIIIGVVTSVISLLLYIKTKEKLTGYYLFFHSSFSLLVISEFLLDYINTNLAYVNPLTENIIKYSAEYAAIYLMLFTLPLFVNVLRMGKNTRKNSIIWGLVVLLLMAIQIVTESAGIAVLDSIGDIWEDISIVGVVGYCVWMLLGKYKKYQNQTHENTARSFFYLTLLFIPAIVFDTIFSEYLEVKFFFLVYICYSMMFSYKFTKAFIKPNEAMYSLEKESVLLEEANISRREQEVLDLVLKGFSNKKIGEELFISQSTVKTHISNIFAKLNVNNRYELIAKLSKSSQ